MTTYAIPGYLGLVTICAVGSDITEDGYMIPCSKINWHSGASMSALYTASSSPYCDVSAGFNDPGYFEFWGPFRTDFNPFTSSPKLKIGQTVQAIFSDYAGQYDSYAPQAVVELFDFMGEANKQPFYHIIMVANFLYNGTGSDYDVPTSSTIFRGQGDDNDAGTGGFV